MPDLSRRRFLGGALASAALLRGIGALEQVDDPARRVVVVGAGLAGLTAALDLTDLGWDVVVLEARDRVGGRVHTIREAFSHGLHAEAGGESIDEGHHALLAMIRRFGLSTERRPPQKPYDAVTFVDGHRNRLPLYLAGKQGKVLEEILAFSDAQAALGNGVDPVHPERARHAERLDQTSLEDFIRAQKLSREAEFIVRLQNRALYNAEPRDLSLLFIAQQGAQEANEETTPLDSLILTETRRIRGGNDQLPRKMAAALGGRVRVGAPVSRVEHRADRVRVFTAAGAPPTDAAWLVVATPMQPLRRVTFSPALPAALAAAVDGLDLGHAVKVTREYTVPFWTVKGYSGFTLTDLPFAVAWSPTDSQTTTRGLLTEFITGDAAVQAAAMAPDVRVREFLRQLDEVYPDGVPFVTGRVATTAWANEPYTGGGYAAFKPGQMAPFFATIRAGAGRIRFAGEHTCELAGYMESAVRSGHRVASEIGRSKTS